MSKVFIDMPENFLSNLLQFDNITIENKPSNKFPVIYAIIDGKGFYENYMQRIEEKNEEDLFNTLNWIARSGMREKVASKIYPGATEYHTQGCNVPYLDKYIAFQPLEYLGKYAKVEHDGLVTFVTYICFVPSIYIVPIEEILNLK